MNEETKNTSVGAENIENNAAQGAETEAVKKSYTEEEVNRIVENRLKRERNRTDKQFKDYDGFKQVFNTLKEVGAVDSDDPETAVSRLKEFYGKGGGESAGEPSVKEPTNTAAVLPKDQRIALIEYSVEKYVKNASEEDIEDDYETLKSKGKRRTDEEDIKFTAVAKRLAEINTKKSVEKQIEDFQTKYPKVNLDDLKANEDFRRFTQFSARPLVETYEFYLNAKGVKPEEKRDLGSVSSQGNTNEKDLLTPDQIRGMTPDERSKNRELIRRSILANARKT